jgi:biotin synthase-like enzyme
MIDRKILEAAISARKSGSNVLPCTSSKGPQQDLGEICSFIAEVETQDSFHAPPGIIKRAARNLKGSGLHRYHQISKHQRRFQ